MAVMSFLLWVQAMESLVDATFHLNIFQQKLGGNWERNPLLFFYTASDRKLGRGPGTRRARSYLTIRTRKQLTQHGQSEKVYWNDATSELPLTSVGQSHSRCGFLLLASALESRDTPTCSDIQRQQLFMFIVTTFLQLPSQLPPHLTATLCPLAITSLPRLLLAPNSNSFCLNRFNAPNRKPGSEDTFLPLHFLPPQPLSTYSTDING